MTEAEKHIAYVFERLAEYQKQVEKAEKPKVVKKAEKKEKSTS